MTWQDKDWLDQPLHLAVGLIGTFTLGQWMSWLEASTFVMGCAYVRELNQHDWDWYRVGLLDLFFFAIGAALAAFFI